MNHSLAKVPYFGALCEEEKMKKEAVPAKLLRYFSVKIPRSQESQLWKLLVSAKKSTVPKLIKNCLIFLPSINLHSSCKFGPIFEIFLQRKVPTSTTVCECVT